MSESESTGKSTALGSRAKVGEPMPQAHGGVLRRGGTNKGGTGRPPSEIRASCRERFDKLVPKLGRIASAKTSKDSDKIKAIEVLGRFGMDRAVSIVDVKSALKSTTEEIRDFLKPEQADALLARIQPHWRKL